MATKRPSFLKRQKELKRTARAQEKREARRGRKETRGMEHDISAAPDLLLEETEQNPNTEL
jgi:hypothetical protein